jgi:hypothetical protein
MEFDFFILALGGVLSVADEIAPVESASAPGDEPLPDQMSVPVEPANVAKGRGPIPENVTQGHVRVYRGTRHPTDPQVSYSMEGKPMVEVPSGAENFASPGQAELHANGQAHNLTAGWAKKSMSR